MEEVNLELDLSFPREAFQASIELTVNSMIEKPLDNGHREMTNQGLYFHPNWDVLQSNSDANHPELAPDATS